VYNEVPLTTAALQFISTFSNLSLQSRRRILPNEIRGSFWPMYHAGLVPPLCMNAARQYFRDALR